MEPASLTNIFKYCLNVLRDNEGLTGEKALRTLNYLLILKMLEPAFDPLTGSIDLDNYPYDFLHEDSTAHYRSRLLQIARFSNLPNEHDGNLATNMTCLWDNILSKHPSTHKIFIEGKGFDIEHISTYKALVKKLAALDLTTTPYDVLGNAYEEVIKDVMVGKVLGQFFTQPIVKKLMVKLLDPQIHPDGTIDSCADPTMGTGGFLITYLQTILVQAKAKGIAPDWAFIKNEGLYGKELDPDTYQLAVANMLISSGHMFEGLERGDSIRVPIERKFDNILANPPFGIKGLKYDEYASTLKSVYTPIKSDNAVSLFLQAIIYMLKIGGKGAVVLPDGQDLFSKTNASLMAVREYLMKTCELKEVIYLPAGIFTHTSIRTCVIYFVKKREGTEVLTVVSDEGKRKPKTKAKHVFVEKALQTSEVVFYDYEPTNETKTLLVRVPIETIVRNAYALNYNDYLVDQTPKRSYEADVVVKTLGDLCTFLPKSKRNAKYGSETGRYPFFKSSMIVKSFVDEADYNDESIIIGDGGEPNVNYGVHFSTSDHCYVLQNKNNNKDHELKYVYYYLFHNLSLMEKLYTGVAIKNISKTSIEGLTIPLPSLERQQGIVEYLDFIYEDANKSSTAKIAQLQKLNAYAVHNQQKYGKNEDDMKTLGDVCTFLPKSKRSAKYGSETGRYPFFKSSMIVKSFVDEADYNEASIIIGDGGEPNVNYGVQFSTSDHCYVLQNKDRERFVLKYAYYYLLHNLSVMEKLYTGVAIKNISKTSIEGIKVSIPTFERQKTLVKYCEANDKLIAKLEAEIARNISEATAVINSIIVL
jgi:type I restriction-modification system DNA methylase subunit